MNNEQSAVGEALRVKASLTYKQAKKEYTDNPECIYFPTDKSTILFNGKEYGESEKPVKSEEYIRCFRAIKPHVHINQRKASEGGGYTIKAKGERIFYCVTPLIFIPKIYAEKLDKNIDDFIEENVIVYFRNTLCYIGNKSNTYNGVNIFYEYGGTGLPFYSYFKVITTIENNVITLNIEPIPYDYALSYHCNKNKYYISPNGPIRKNIPEKYINKIKVYADSVGYILTLKYRVNLMSTKNIEKYHTERINSRRYKIARRTELNAIGCRKFIKCIPIVYDREHYYANFLITKKSPRKYLRKDILNIFNTIFIGYIKRKY